MLANIGASFYAALERGEKFIRLLGNIKWGRANWPSEKDTLAFEAKVTGALKLFPSVVCLYDVNLLPGERVRRHPPRFARLATTAASSVSSTGFGTCIWYPARSAWSLSSVRA